MKISKAENKEVKELLVLTRLKPVISTWETCINKSEDREAYPA